MTISQIFLVFDDLENVEEYCSGVCRGSLNWNVFIVFLMIRLGLWVWGRKTVVVKCHSHHIKSRVSAINMTSLLLVLTLITCLTLCLLGSSL